MADIQVQHLPQVCEITLNRASKKNALSQAMYVILADSINQANEDESIRVIHIKGAGETFCAGNDLQDFAQADSAQQFSATVSFMHALIQCKKPVVAEVRGLAVGIGTTMLLHCDLVLCSRSATFTLPFIDLALVPEFASSYLLPKLAGHRKASKWLMLGEPFAAEEAEQFGLVSEVVSEEDLAERCQQVVSSLAGKPPHALGLTKALMKNEEEEILLHMNDELDVFIEQLSQSEAQQIIQAFLSAHKA